MKKLQVTKVSLFMIISLLLIIGGGVFFYKAIKMDNRKQVLTYRSSNSINYRVHLKENNDYPEYLDENKQYISSLIDMIKINFKYNLSSSNFFDSNYKYRIVAVLTADHKVDNDTYKNVLTKEYILKDSNMNLVNQARIEIAENIDFDYQYYNDEIKRFKEQYPMALTSKLTIKFETSVDGKNYDCDNQLSDKVNSEIIIPLLDQTIGITKKISPSVDSALYKTVNKPSVKKEVYLIVSSFIIVIGMMLLVPAISAVKLVYKQNEYLRTIKRYLRDYDEIIVSAVEPVSLFDKPVLDITNFNDLLDVEQELHIPIVYSDVEHNKEVWFTITSSDQIWRYRFINERK